MNTNTAKLTAQLNATLVALRGKPKPKRERSAHAVETERRALRRLRRLAACNGLRFTEAWARDHKLLAVFRKFAKRRGYDVTHERQG